MRNRKKYPKNWGKLSRQCREAANNQCTKCGVVHGTKRVSIWTGRLWPVWLQAAHVYHDPDNTQPELVAVCPTCHWHYFRRPGQHLTNGVIEAKKHRILLERKHYHGPWRPVEA